VTKRKLCWVHIKKIIIHLNNINLLVLLMINQCFLCEMTEFLCVIQAEFRPQNFGRKKLSLCYKFPDISPFLSIKDIIYEWRKKFNMLKRCFILRDLLSV